MDAGREEPRDAASESGEPHAADAGDAAPACTGSGCACTRKAPSTCKVDAFRECPSNFSHVCDGLPSKIPPQYSRALSRCGSFLMLSGMAYLDPGTGTEYSLYYSAAGEFLGAKVDYTHIGSSSGSNTHELVCDSYSPSFSPDDVPPCTLLPCDMFPPNCVTMCLPSSDAGSH